LTAFDAGLSCNDRGYDPAIAIPVAINQVACVGRPLINARSDAGVMLTDVGLSGQVLA